jgi:hypothetical protein
MDVEELKIALEKEGVNPIYYSLNGSTKRAWMGAFILENKETEWLVYYYERNNISHLMKYSSEDEACKYMLEQLLRDPIHKIFPPKRRGFRRWFHDHIFLFFF